MKRVMGVINLIDEPDQLEELTLHRCAASVPFGGRYRLIDFALSNMVNSGIEDVAVFTQHKYRSLMDHLGSGKEWDLDRKRGGLFLLPSVLDGRPGGMKGDLCQFFAHRDYFYRGKQEYVVISRSHVVCNIDLRPVLDFHEAVRADITCIYKEMDNAEDSIHHKLRVESSGRITAMQEQTGRLSGTSLSLEIYVLRKSLLLDMVETCLAQGDDYLVRDGMMKNISRLKLYGYKYDGYAGIVNTIPSYYRHSMELLSPDVLRELFFQTSAPIYTKVKDEPPAKYGEAAAVKHSLVANGSSIEGTVENSIVSRGVKVKKGACVRNAILLQNCEIGENVVVENAILDKDVWIDRGRVLTGAVTAPFIAAKKKVI
ncbi:glucose-1-phosphate adenylyltransferase subunit GlgD [Paenibacillus thermotolerans]|uniref:glucose-1-phosphate adenylyltransferase subunit GlgD n=1 Tax=Paenibacillus thermotolerans TaxID=3027807 RepID=UPI002367B95C|nr:MULTISPECIES: glucose-1-phosphate adenylyltransferase subunit GlgD [unclassified Paenibacillus]